jgi:hypothetical protein
MPYLGWWAHPNGMAYVVEDGAVVAEFGPYTEHTEMGVSIEFDGQYERVYYRKDGVICRQRFL